MTLDFAYLFFDTLKQVGNPEHLKVFADAAAAETWFVENLAAPPPAIGE